MMISMLIDEQAMRNLFIVSIPMYHITTINYSLGCESYPYTL